MYATSSSITTYFNLELENKTLLEENRRLRKLLINQKLSDTVEMDTSNLSYSIVAAKIIRNSYANPNNYLTINKGSASNIRQDMGVITSDGILGIIENTSAKFATVQSILNRRSNINAKIKNTNYSGSLVWDTKNYHIVQLTDIPRLVKLSVGDTVVTGGMSSIFPENIPIGTIRKFDLNTSKSSFIVDVMLFSDMTNVKNVYIIDNLQKREIKQLESLNK